MDEKRTDLGEKSDLAAICELMDVSGLKLVDVGCGPATVSRELAGMGATVLGVEPDPIQAEKNRQMEPVEGFTFTEGGAEKLPLESGSVDGVFFFRSLHHVPVEHIDDALAEAARVLKPETGFLCVVEPGVTGTHFPIMRPFHDETYVRAQAQAALGRMKGKLFDSEGFYSYVQYPRHQSFESMVEKVTGLTYNNITRDQVETEEVRELFEQGKTDEGDYCFEQPMLLDLYRGVAVTQAA